MAWHGPKAKVLFHAHTWPRYATEEELYMARVKGGTVTRKRRKRVLKLAKG